MPHTPRDADFQYSDVRYLLSKKSVDDRALNRYVLGELQHRLQRRATQSPLRVLEIGAGVGTMASRLVEWKVVERGWFTLVDRDQSSLSAAHEHLLNWGATRGHVDELSTAQAQRISITGNDVELTVDFVCLDALAFCGLPDHQMTFDLVMANAVLDLMDLYPALTEMYRALRKDGHFWFSINFDGETIFLPEHPLDRQVFALYHRDMDDRITDGKPAGDSKTGRHLLQAIPKTGARVEAAGSSDWVVFPEDGGYRNDEAYFLRHIVHTIWQAVHAHPEMDSVAFEHWHRQRHAQIDRGELCYIAHQLDVLGNQKGR